MPRANRHYIPGCVWHITHRCHKQEFLLKFAKDRKRYLHWLFEAKKRYGLKILNYMVTSNHVHLLLLDTGEDVISKSIQLTAGRMAQEYNQRKKRKGAFWEDRYHATAIETDSHLYRCIVYIDLNMVRAGVVDHPSEGSCCGYGEIQNPPERYSLIDRKGLVGLCGNTDYDSLKCDHKQWVEEALEHSDRTRESCWAESIAVGNKTFIEETKIKLGIRSQGRDTVEDGDKYSLKEPSTPYNTVFDPEKGLLRFKNAFLWNNYDMNSVC